MIDYTNRALNHIQKGTLVTMTMQPTWRNLKTSSGGGLPIEEFVGDCKSWGVAPDNFQNMSLNMSFENIEVHQSDTPWPYPECVISIKLSDVKNSGWGKFGESLALVLNVDINDIDIDKLSGQRCHLVRHKGVHYGTNRTTKEEILGNAWELVAFIPPGGAPTWKLPGNDVAGAVTASAPTVPATAPDGSTPYDVAMKHLHGKSLLDFHQAAFNDPVVKTDQTLVNKILDKSFIDEAVAAGKVQIVGVEPDITYSIVGM